HRDVDRLHGGAAARIQDCRIYEADRGVYSGGDERPRRNIEKVETSNRVLATDVEALVGRNDSAVVTGRPGGLDAQAYDIALVESGVEVCHLENILDGIDVTTQGATLKSERIGKALAACRIQLIIHCVVTDRGTDFAGDNSVERGRTLEAAELQGLE